MEGYDLIDIKRRVLVVKKCRELIVLLNNDFKHNDVLELIEYNSSIIDKYNRATHEIINPTNTELGSFRSSCKKMIKPYFENNEAIYDLIDKTVFSEEIQHLYICMNRYYPYCYKKPEPLREELKNTIRIELINEFRDYNKDKLKT